MLEPGDELTVSAQGEFGFRGFLVNGELLPPSVDTYTVTAGDRSYAKDESVEKTAYHASCHLCRGLGVKDAPRQILKAATDYIPSAEEESCCGFGGTFSAKFPEISAELMRRKLANVSASGAKRLALDCPGCAMQIGGGADRLKIGLRVSHVAELLAEALR